MDNIFPVYNTGVNHKPAEPGDKLAVSLLPLSQRTANQLQALDDGLYAGTHLGTNTLYVAASGTDISSAGFSKATPFKTLDYALSYLTTRSPTGVFTGEITIALKAADTFTLGADFTNAGDLTIAFYDSNYGDYTSPLVGTGAEPAVMQDLNRPVVNVQAFNANAQWQSAGIRCVKGGTLTLLGLRVNLAVRPAAQPPMSLYGGLSDFVTATNRSAAYVHIKGTVINQSPNSYFGFLGMHARCGIATLSQFASQFMVDGVLVGADPAVTPSADVLMARQWLLKFYADNAGNNHTFTALSASSTNSSSGSGMLALEWSDVQAQIVQGVASNLASYPVLFNASWGIRNYFYNLIRGQQQQPLNVISPRLF